MDKKVLLIRNVQPKCYGGGESYQLLLAEELKKHGFIPIVISSSEKLLEEAQRFGYKTVQAPFCKRQNWSGWRNILFPVYCIWQVRLCFWYKKQIKKYKPVAMNIQSRDDWIAATKAGKKCGVRILWTDHIDFRTWVLKNINVKYKNFIGKWILKLANIPDKIIMISDYEYESFKRDVAPRKFNNLVVIKNGVEDVAKKYNSVAIQPKSICYVGRLIDYKGINELIGAYEKVDDGILNIYGDGADVGKYKKMAENNKGIVFHGFVHDPLKVIAENEVFVLPSYYEGLSIALIQATMMGKMIIATNVDGNPEVVIDKETGLLVPSKDTNSLAEAIKYALQHKKETKEFGENARKFYEKNFDFAKIFAEKMLPLYNDKKE